MVSNGIYSKIAQYNHINSKHNSADYKCTTTTRSPQTWYSCWRHPQPLVGRCSPTYTDGSQGPSREACEVDLWPPDTAGSRPRAQVQGRSKNPKYLESREKSKTGAILHEWQKALSESVPPMTLYRSELESRTTSIPLLFLRNTPWALPEERSSR